MADANFDITLGDIAYILFVRCFLSLGKGILNSLHLRKRNQCHWCQTRLNATSECDHNLSPSTPEIVRRDHPLVSGIIV